MLGLKSGQVFGGRRLRVAAADKPGILVLVVEVYRLWAWTSPPKPIENNIAEILVTPPKRPVDTIPPKEKEVIRRTFLRIIPLVTQDNDKKGRALDFFSATGSMTNLMQDQGFHVESLDIHYKKVIEASMFRIRIINNIQRNT